MKNTAICCGKKWYGDGDCPERRCSAIYAPMTTHPSFGTTPDANCSLAEQTKQVKVARLEIQQEQTASLCAMQLLAKKFGENWYDSHDHAD